MTPPYTFIPRKCKKNCPHKILANFQIESTILTGKEREREREREREGEREKEGGRKSERKRAETMYNQITFMFSKEYHGNILSY